MPQMRQKPKKGILLHFRHKVNYFFFPFFLVICIFCRILAEATFSHFSPACRQILPAGTNTSLEFTVFWNKYPCLMRNSPTSEGFLFSPGLYLTKHKLLYRPYHFDYAEPSRASFCFLADSFRWKLSSEKFILKPSIHIPCPEIHFNMEEHLPFICL